MYKLKNITCLMLLVSDFQTKKHNARVERKVQLYEIYRTKTRMLRTQTFPVINLWFTGKAIWNIHCPLKNITRFLFLISDLQRRKQNQGVKNKVQQFDVYCSNTNLYPAINLRLLEKEIKSESIQKCSYFKYSVQMQEYYLFSVTKF